MAGADLRLAEQQRRVVPAAIERVGDLVGDARHLRLVLAEAVDDRGRVGEELGAAQLVVIGGQRDVGPVLLQKLEEPVAELDIAIAGGLGLPQRLNERLVADPVELAGDRLDADVCAHGLPLPSSPSTLRRCAARRLTTWNRASVRIVSSVFAQFGAIQLVQPSWTLSPEANRRDLAGGNRQLHIPIVFLSDVKENRVGDLARERRARQKLPEMGDVADDRRGRGTCR